MIYVKDLSVASRLGPLTFAAEAGKKIHIIGPNGSGKSTLLNAIAGMGDYEGSIAMDGQDLRQFSCVELASLRSFLPQQEQPLFSLSVYQYLHLVLPAGHTSASAAVEAAIGYLLTALKLTDKLEQGIHQLSGGEWQRVRIAGSCLQVWPTLNPTARVLLLDEPAAALDIGQERLLYELLDELVAQGRLVLMSNHDLNRTLHYADNVLLLNHGQLDQAGTADQVLIPATIERVFGARSRVVEVENRRHLVFD